MVYYFKNANKRKVDESLEIIDLYTKKQDPLDCVIGKLHGFHGSFINHSSDKNYLILDGTGIVTIDTQNYTVTNGDFVRVPKGIKHSIDGDMKFALFCNPPYDFTTEEILSSED